MVEDRAYLIRYGVMGYVGRFRTAPDCAGPLARGQSVVVRTERGVELGEVLIPLDEAAARARDVEHQAVIRPAGPADLERSRRALASRPDRFATCLRVLDEEGWPWDLVDVEPLLEDDVTVLQYLGPHHLDAAPIRARFRMTCGLEVVFEPVGEDVAHADEPGAEHGCGSSGGCGSCGDGGCGSRAAGADHDLGRSSGCGASVHGGCASCGLSRLASSRREETAATIV